MTSELTEAERYVEAYTNIVEEVGVLVQRNALAEEEAERLSKFNAEILGHRNPAQRIMYVDRIRRELHEMKQVRLIFLRNYSLLRLMSARLGNTVETYRSDTGERGRFRRKRGTPLRAGYVQVHRCSRRQQTKSEHDKSNTYAPLQPKPKYNVHAFGSRRTRKKIRIFSRDGVPGGRYDVG